MSHPHPTPMKLNVHMAAILVKSARFSFFNVFLNVWFVINVRGVVMTLHTYVVYYSFRNRLQLSKLWIFKKYAYHNQHSVMGERADCTKMAAMCGRSAASLYMHVCAAPAGGGACPCAAGQKKSGPRGAMERLRVLELYSGIGGMHYALQGEPRAFVRRPGGRRETLRLGPPGRRR